MGTGSGGQQASGTTSSKYEMAPEERHAMETQNRIADAAAPSQMMVNEAALANVDKLLKGKDLPGYLQPLPYGISEERTADISNRALKDIQPFFGQAGLLDSGVNAQVSARTAGDIRRATAEFNINNLMQLLNIGVGGTAQVQQPVLQSGSILAGLVKGTGTTTGTYSNQSSYRYTNPFAQTYGQLAQGTNQWMSAGGKAAGMFTACWVAAELFGGWNKIKTHMVRYFMMYMAPKWLYESYKSHGKSIAEYIHNKPILKSLLRPFFEFFAFLGSVSVKEVCHG